MENKIRKIIRETLDEVLLDEDYEGIQEIKTLANDTLKTIAELNAKPLVEWVTKNPEKDVYFMSVNLYDVYKKNEDKYKQLSHFLRNAKKLYVYIQPVWRKKGIEGDYSHINQDFYNPHLEREINLYFDKDFVKEVKEKIVDNLKNYDKFDASDLYFLFYYKFISTAIHELQHAYDDARSNSKMFKSKQHKEFVKLDKELEIAEEKNKEQFLKRNLQYINLPVEVWARFSQAMDKVRFSSSEMIDDEKGMYFLPKMKDIHQVAKDFKLEMAGFHLLDDDMKKRLLRKIAQFWHIEHEKVKEEIKNPIMLR